MPKEREEGTLASMREVPSFVLLFRSWFLEPVCFLGEIERLSTCMRVRESCLGAVYDAFAGDTQAENLARPRACAPFAPLAC
jgi:hypothetical protein